jgi:hypothetical protein
MQTFKTTTSWEKMPVWNSIPMHMQDFSVGDKVLLAILKVFVPQPLNKQQTIRFYVFMYAWTSLINKNNK